MKHETKMQILCPSRFIIWRKKIPIQSILWQKKITVIQWYIQWGHQKASSSYKTLFQPTSEEERCASAFTTGHISCPGPPVQWDSHSVCTNCTGSRWHGNKYFQIFYPWPSDQDPGLKHGLTLLTMQLSVLVKTAGMSKGLVTHWTHIWLFSCEVLALLAGRNISHRWRAYLLCVLKGDSSG